jgi:hypothetical protein
VQNSRAAGPAATTRSKMQAVTASFDSFVSQVAASVVRLNAE